MDFLDRFSENTHIKFNENLSSGSRFFPCGKIDGQTDMTKLIAVFGNFANAPKNLIGNFVLLGKLTNKIYGKHETDSLDNEKGNSILKHVASFMNCNEHITLTQTKGDCC